jgi:hypothetical protein
MPCQELKTATTETFRSPQTEGLRRLITVQRRGVQTQPQNLEEKYKKLEEKIKRVAINTIVHTGKQANKEWFDEECAKMNEKKNSVSEPSKSKPEKPRMLPT